MRGRRVVPLPGAAKVEDFGLIYTLPAPRCEGEFVGRRRTGTVAFNRAKHLLRGDEVAGDVPIVLKPEFQWGRDPEVASPAERHMTYRLPAMAPGLKVSKQLSASFAFV